jgi:hypothetical protein
VKAEEYDYDPSEIHKEERAMNEWENEKVGKIVRVSRIWAVNVFIRTSVREMHAMQR